MTANLPLYNTYDGDYMQSPPAYIAYLQNALEENAAPGTYSLPFTIVASGANGTSTFLTKEAAGAYLYSLHAADLLIDINSVCNNFFISTTFLPCKLPFTKSATITPMATIGSAPTNLATNYNLVSGILGLANGLNDANAKQNDLADKFNHLITGLKSQGIVTP